MANHKKQYFCYILLFARSIIIYCVLFTWCFERYLVDNSKNDMKNKYDVDD